MVLPCTFIAGTSPASGTSLLDASDLNIKGRCAAPSLLRAHGCYDGRFSTGTYFLVAVQVVEKSCFDRNLKGGKIADL